ncbi:hypothetical protein MES4922_620009 [Mesorhizobium ventifaucium]|uniref:Uncharacterized protein n=1 Tax=Mesorhizobium ventifaucium TaxID=666020 RepID=A0ABM9EEW7_9HYPH|nr:hypothetical protein MES4922_620009 [Mesorhizobium ventifaucium]
MKRSHRKVILSGWRRGRIGCNKVTHGHRMPNTLDFLLEIDPSSRSGDFLSRRSYQLYPLSKA